MTNPEINSTKVSNTATTIDENSSKKINDFTHNYLPFIIVTLATVAFLYVFINYRNRDISPQPEAEIQQIKEESNNESAIKALIEPAVLDTDLEFKIEAFAKIIKESEPDQSQCANGISGKSSIIRIEHQPGNFWCLDRVYLANLTGIKDPVALVFDIEIINNSANDFINNSNDLIQVFYYENKDGGKVLKSGGSFISTSTQVDAHTSQTSRLGFVVPNIETEFLLAYGNLSQAGSIKTIKVDTSQGIVYEISAPEAQDLFEALGIKTNSAVLGSVSWTEANGQLGFTVTGATLGYTKAPRGLSGYKEGDAVYALILSMDIVVKNTGSVTTELRRVDEEGNFYISNTPQFYLPGSGGTYSRPFATYKNQQLYFVVDPGQNKFMFNTDPTGNSSVLFVVEKTSRGDLLIREI